MDDVHQRLKQLREAAGMTQPEVARRINELRPDWSWHQTTVAKIESEERRVSLADAVAYAELFGMTLSDLVGDGEVKELEYSAGFDKRVRERIAADRAVIQFEIESHRARIFELERKLERMGKEPESNG